MTTKEEKSINDLRTLLQEIRSENQRFRETVINQVAALSERVDKKHLPLNLEEQVMKTVESTIATALTASLSGYNSPLGQYAINIVSKYKDQISAIFDEAVKEAIHTDEFKTRVREVLIHKIAKTMIAGVDGSVDKTINLMKQDAVFRSRLTLTVNSLVEEFLTQHK